MQHQHPEPVNNPSPVSNPKTSDEISLKDFINEFSLWKRLIWNNFLKIMFVGLVGGTVGFAYAYFDTPVYTAKTRFMLKNEGVGSLFGGQMTGLSSLLGGGQMGSPLERTSEVLASDRIVGRSLLRLISVRDSLDLTINHFIRLSGIRKSWEKDTALKNVIFSEENQNIQDLNIAQRKAYKYVKNMMTPESGDGVVRKSFDKKSGVLTLLCVHKDQDLSIALSKAIYDELNNFFVEQMTYSANNNAAVMRQKLDSIKRELDAVRKMYASQSDQSLGLLLQMDKVDLKAMSIKEQMLNVMYAEAVKNYESFEFINKAAVPSIMLIDSPMAPIKPTQKSKITFGILSSFILMFLFIVRIRLIFWQKI
jgi:uncharacterized protein involved in exopolysaccharide biosynthesis